MTEPTSGDQDTSPQVPRSLILAWWFWVASALVGVVRTVVQVTDRNMMLEQLRQVDPELSQADLDAAVNGQIMFTLLTAAMSVLVYVLLAQRMVQGRVWARVVLAVFGGFTVLGTVLTLSMVVTMGLPLLRELTDIPLNVWDLVVVTASSLLSGVALGFMFRRDANAFFRAHRGRYQRSRLF